MDTGKVAGRSGRSRPAAAEKTELADEKMRHRIRDVRKRDVHTRQLRGERFLVWQAIG